MLKWYKVYINCNVFLSNLDVKLVKNFIRLMYEEKSQNGLAIYLPKQNHNFDIVYYISTPEDCLDRVKDFLGPFSSMEISTPDYKSIELVAGINSECRDIPD